MKILIAKLLALCALFVLVAGCAVGPDYVRPEVDTADTRADVALKLVATYEALGGGWEIEHSEGAQK